MKASGFSLPLLRLDALDMPVLQLHTPATSSQGLPRVEWVERGGPALHSTAFSDNGDVLGLNLTCGCPQRCVFCSVRGSAHYVGEERVQLYRRTAEALATELAALRHRPRAVFVSPAADPFAPFAEVQEETAQVVEVLAAHGVEAWLMTRGYIRPAALARLEKQRDWLKVTVALTTLERKLQRILEPLTASPSLRLRQIAELRERGVHVQAALDPLLPGLTDTRANLGAVLEAVAAVGVRHVSAGYLFLRPGIRANLSAALEPHGLAETVLHAFDNGPMLTARGLAPARYLPKARRQRGYASLMALAAGLDITVTINSATNPDFSATRRPQREVLPRQALLPLFAGRNGEMA